MKITLVVATTQDGFINHVGQKHASDWTSPEDQQQFAALLATFTLQFMGSTTYLANKDSMKRSSRRRRIVFTHTPEKYQSIPNEVEFTGEPLLTVVHRLEKAGYERAALVGGSHLYTQFLDAGLVDEVFLTLEPLTFGTGIPFLTNGLTLQDYTYLHLTEDRPLNESGTRLLHYECET